MADTLVIFGDTFTNVAGIKATDNNSGTKTYIRPEGTKSITANGTGIDVTEYAAVDVNVSGGGGGGEGGSLDDDVVFIDYDGTVLHSYSASDFANLTAMPSNPSHSGLTAQGWNWSLSDAKAQVTAMGRCIIGQMYTTDDNKTRIYIHLGEERKSPMLGLCPNGTVDVDWGDGSTHDTLTGTSLTTIRWTPTHNYAHGGDYVIKLTVTTGSAAIVGDSSTNVYCRLLHYDSAANVRNFYYITAIKRVEVGSGISIGACAFYYCYALKSVTMPSTATSIGQYAFYYCTSLLGLTVPDGATSIGNYTFRYCYSLRSVAIPKTSTTVNGYAFNYCTSLAGVAVPSGATTNLGTYAFAYCSSLTRITIPSSHTTINTYTFQTCYSLSSLTIPSTVATISANAFINCYGMAEYHLLRETPPTLSNTSAFSGIPADCKIYVPYSADHSILEAYQTANNWSTYASYMVEEAQ